MINLRILVAALILLIGQGALADDKTMHTLPEGFVLDKPNAFDLPEGYVLDKPNAFDKFGKPTSKVTKIEPSRYAAPTHPSKKFHMCILAYIGQAHTIPATTLVYDACKALQSDFGK